VDTIRNLLSSLGCGRFRHGIAESNSVVRPGIKLMFGRFRQGLLSPIFGHLERSIRVRCKRWCNNSMPGGMSDSVGAF
jgi:hypothetical protein